MKNKLTLQDFCVQVLGMSVRSFSHMNKRQKVEAIKQYNNYINKKN